MIAYFVRHPVAANLLMVLICILGVSVIQDMERETFPEHAASTVGVSVVYPGASARDVDEEICSPLEDALTGLPGLADLQCLSRDGRAAATAELVEGGDISVFFNDIFSTVARIDDFPADTETPVVEIQSRPDPVAMIVVSGIVGKQGLVEYTDLLADRILALNGVSEAAVSGISDRELRIVFDENALRRYGLAARNIVDAINAHSLTEPLGDADMDSNRVVLRYADVRRSVADLEDLVVLQDRSGGMVRLRDLASVLVVDSDRNVNSFIDGEQAAIITISKSGDADSINVFALVEELLEAERAAYPEPFKLTVINNSSEFVEENLNIVFRNIAMGLVLVFGTMWLLFSLREALWISAALPVSFLGAVFFMSMLGVTINMISLVAFLMAVGLIMDDSIVIAENIEKWRRNAGPLEAAVQGTKEVMPGILSSFLTTACVFGPMLFMAGDIGQILRFIPMVLLVMLALSLVEGFLILPHHLRHSGGGTAVRRPRPAARFLDALLERAVFPLAKFLASIRYLTVGTAVAALILTIGLVVSGAVKMEGFPDTESDTVIARLSLTSGIDRERTVETVDRLLEALERVDTDLTPDTEGGAPLVERVLVQYAVNSEVHDNGSNTATITVDLLESALRNVRADDVLLAWREAAGPIPDLIQSSFSQSEGGPGGMDLDVELRSRDLKTLETAAGELLKTLISRADVTEAYQDFYGSRKEVWLALNAYGYSTGLTPQSLADQMRSAFQGVETDSFRYEKSNMTVRVQLGNTMASMTDLELFPISLRSGRQVALAQIADMTLATGYPTITRSNGLAVARIRGKIDKTATTSAEISAVVTDSLGPELKQRYPGIEIGIGGATEAQNESQSSLIRLMLLGLVGVYMVLAFQFRSYMLPLVIMFAIPFALIGTILGHWGMGIAISMPSLVGFASLAGIVVNNSILFLTFFQTHMKDEDYVAAALEALRARFRPIVLSTVTTIAGLLPLVTDTSPQMLTLVSIAVSVAFGLFASMVMVTLVFPALISIYFDMFSVKSWSEKFRSQPAGSPGGG